MSLLSSLVFFPRGVANSPHPQFISSPWLLKSTQFSWCQAKFGVEISELLKKRPQIDRSVFSQTVPVQMCDRYPMTWSVGILWTHSYVNVIPYSSEILDMALDGHVQYSSISSRKRDSVFFHPCKIISKDQDLFSDPVFKPHISLNLKFQWMGRKRRFLKWFLELSASRRSVVLKDSKVAIGAWPKLLLQSTFQSWGQYLIDRDSRYLILIQLHTAKTLVE